MAEFLARKEELTPIAGIVLMENAASEVASHASSLLRHDSEPAAVIVEPHLEPDWTSRNWEAEAKAVSGQLNTKVNLVDALNGGEFTVDEADLQWLRDVLTIYRARGGTG